MLWSLVAGGLFAILGYEKFAVRKLRAEKEREESRLQRLQREYDDLAQQFELVRQEKFRLQLHSAVVGEKRRWVTVQAGPTH